jgi:hypothetical protein
MVCRPLPCEYLKTQNNRIYDTCCVVLRPFAGLQYKRLMLSLLCSLQHSTSILYRKLIVASVCGVSVLWIQNYEDENVMNGIPGSKTLYGQFYVILNFVATVTERCMKRPHVCFCSSLKNSTHISAYLWCFSKNQPHNYMSAFKRTPRRHS